MADAAGSEVETTVARAVARELARQVASDDDLFTLGVDSLRGLRIVARLRDELRVPLTLAAIFERPTVRGLAARVEELRAEGAPLHAIEPLASRTDALPVSFEQQAIWFHDQLSPKDQTNAHDQDVLRLELARPLDRAALDGALAIVLERHEILRTTYETAGGLPRQRVGPVAPLAVDHVDLRGAERDERAVARELVALRCDLKRGPVLRARLVTVADDAHVLFVKAHQIAFDGWSANVLARELSVAYEALVSGRAPDLPPLSLQYADHAADQRQGEDAGRYQEAIAYWRDRLASARATSIPVDRARPKRATYRAASVRWELDDPRCAALRDRARREGATLFTVLASAVACVVAQEVASDDVVLNVLTAGRSELRLQALVGCFLNVLPLRIELGGDPTMREVVARTRRAVTDAFANDAPFDAILRALARPRTEGPLTEVSVVMEVPTERREGDAFTAEWLLNDHDPATAPPVVFMFVEHGPTLACRILYKTDLFDEARIARLRASLEARLAALAAGGDERFTLAT